MLNLTQDISSLTDFKRQTTRYVRRLKRTGDPLVLTVNGRAVLVVQDAGSYQALLDLQEHTDAVAATREGLDDLDAGRHQPATIAFAAIRKRHKIPSAE